MILISTHNNNNNNDNNSYSNNSNSKKCSNKNVKGKQKKKLQFTTVHVTCKKNLAPNNYDIIIMCIGNDNKLYLLCL